MFSLSKGGVIRAATKINDNIFKTTLNEKETIKRIWEEVFI
jgi:hypothetical protein